MCKHDDFGLVFCACDFVHLLGFAAVTNIFTHIGATSVTNLIHVKAVVVAENGEMRNFIFLFRISPAFLRLAHFLQYLRFLAEFLFSSFSPSSLRQCQSLYSFLMNAETLESLGLEE